MVNCEVCFSKREIKRFFFPIKNKKKLIDKYFFAIWKLDFEIKSEFI